MRQHLQSLLALHPISVGLLHKHEESDHLIEVYSSKILCSAWQLGTHIQVYYASWIALAMKVNFLRVVFARITGMYAYNVSKYGTPIRRNLH